MCFFFFSVYTAQSACPEWLWSGVGFRLDDGVYSEDRVTRILKQQRALPWRTLTLHFFSLFTYTICPLTSPQHLLPSSAFLFAYFSNLSLPSVASKVLIFHGKSFSHLWVLVIFDLPLTGSGWAGWAGWTLEVQEVALAGVPPPPALALLTQRPASWCLKTTGDRWALIDSWS